MDALGFKSPLEKVRQGVRVAEPCILVIFGATGDLTARKLVPALYNLAREGQLPLQFACVGFARREKDHELFRQEMYTAVNTHSRVKPVDDVQWNRFKEQLYYHRSEFDNDEGYKDLHTFLAELDAKLGTKGNRVFYFSTPPSHFPLITEKLHQHGLLYNSKVEKDKWSRIIIEKPFGHDYSSAVQLQEHLLRFLHEDQIYRIDHYLGKETVQNLLVFRFANAIFESLWNHKFIDHVQITFGEDIGIGTRGHFFEEAGLLRDVVQNHLIQLLCLVAMEPPANLSADAIRDEKVKVLKAIRPFDEEALKRVVRGQYGPGYIQGEPVKGYREEENVAPDSKVETFVAMELAIDNWRWTGVPFYLRGGKRLPKRAAEIAIVFKNAPGILFQQRGRASENNTLAIRIQPDEGISLKINCKVPGLNDTIQPVKMDFRYGSSFGLSPPEAYERLLCDCMGGDSTLFTRGDEVLTSWHLLTPLLEHWASQDVQDFPNYASGSWGPEESEQLLRSSGRDWRHI